MPEFPILGKKFDVHKDGDYILIDHPGAVGILPVLDSGEILLVRQTRRQAKQCLLTTLEIPAGIRDVKGESPELCAIRELEEETGYKCSRIAALAQFMPSCGYTNELIYLYVATGLTPSGVKSESGIDVVKMPLHSLVRDCRVIDSKTIIAAMAYTLLADDLIFSATSEIRS